MDQNLIDKKISDIKNARIFIDEQIGFLLKN